MDQSPPLPSGFVFAYDAWNLGSQPLAYAATAPGSGAMGGGIWQGGGGLAFGRDESGTNYLYFSTANGDFDLNQQNSPGDMADSFIKLSIDLKTIAGYFTPSDQCYREMYADLDYGSGGVILVPDGAVSGYNYIAIKADKENYLWVMDRGSPGGFNNGGCPGPNQGYTCQSYNQNAVPPCPPTEYQWDNQNIQYVQAANDGYPPALDDKSTPAY